MFCNVTVLCWHCLVMARQAMQARREELEQGLSFVGFLVLENELKHETVGYLDMFASAGLRSIMVTGDNPLTAIAVARCDNHFHIFFLVALPEGLLTHSPRVCRALNAASVSQEGNRASMLAMLCCSAMFLLKHSISAMLYSRKWNRL